MPGTAQNESTELEMLLCSVLLVIILSILYRLHAAGRPICLAPTVELSLTSVNDPCKYITLGAGYSSIIFNSNLTRGSPTQAFDFLTSSIVNGFFM